MARRPPERWRGAPASAGTVSASALVPVGCDPSAVGVVGVGTVLACPPGIASAPADTGPCPAGADGVASFIADAGTGSSMYVESIKRPLQLELSGMGPSEGQVGMNHSRFRCPRHAECCGDVTLGLGRVAGLAVLLQNVMSRPFVLDYSLVPRSNILLGIKPATPPSGAHVIFCALTHIYT